MMHQLRLEKEMKRRVGWEYLKTSVTTFVGYGAAFSFVGLIVVDAMIKGEPLATSWMYVMRAFANPWTHIIGAIGGALCAVVRLSETSADHVRTVLFGNSLRDFLRGRDGKKDETETRGT